MVAECAEAEVPNTFAIDITEVRGAARVYGASPVTQVHRSSGIVRLRHALGFVVLVLDAIGVEVTVDLGRREEEDPVGRSRGGAGTDANDKPVTVNGINMYRQNVWIKGKELVSQLGKNLYL